jgi:hypothetical protein
MVTDTFWVRHLGRVKEDNDVLVFFGKSVCKGTRELL